jgi:hypothetical protein
MALASTVSVGLGMRHHTCILSSTFMFEKRGLSVAGLLGRFYTHGRPLPSTQTPTEHGWQRVAPLRETESSRRAPRSGSGGHGARSTGRRRLPCPDTRRAPAGPLGVSQEGTVHGSQRVASPRHPESSRRAPCECLMRARSTEHGFSCVSAQQTSYVTRDFVCAAVVSVKHNTVGVVSAGAAVIFRTRHILAVVLSACSRSGPAISLQWSSPLAAVQDSPYPCNGPLRLQPFSSALGQVSSSCPICSRATPTSSVCTLIT